MRKLLRALKVRPRLVFATCVIVLLPLLLPGDWRWVTRLIVGWVSGVALYLGLVWTMMLRDDFESMKRRAVQEDEGALGVLAFTSIAALASIVAIAAELAGVRELGPDLKVAHVALAGITLLCSWFTVHTIFALHYAHEFYLCRDNQPPLLFPDKMPKPDYADFLYFAITIGAATATADISIASPDLRKVVMAHTILSFFFNTTILAMAINVGAGLL